MTDTDYKPEEDRKPFDVRAASREEIEAYIGDLDVEIDRLRAILIDIANLARSAS